MRSSSFSPFFISDPSDLSVEPQQISNAADVVHLQRRVTDPGSSPPLLDETGAAGKFDSLPGKNSSHPALNAYVQQARQAREPGSPTLRRGIGTEWPTLHRSYTNPLQAYPSSADVKVGAGTSTSTAHALSKFNMLPLAFESILADWEREKNAMFDVETAHSLRDLIVQQRSGITTPEINTENMLKAWGAIPPKLDPELPASDSGLHRRHLEKLMHPKHWPYVNLLSNAASAIFAISREIDNVLAQNDWKAVLHPDIANSPGFTQTYLRMKEILPQVRIALKSVKSAYEALQEAKTSGTTSHQEMSVIYRDAVKKLNLCIAEADAVCGDYEKGMGIIRKASLGSAGYIGLGVMQTVASVVVPPPLVPFVTSAMDFAEDTLRASDRSRTNGIINTLNMQHVDISPDSAQAQAQLKQCWKGPIQAKLELLLVVLSHEISQEKSVVRIKQLESEKEHLKAGKLEKLKSTKNSRAVNLLCDPGAFRNAATAALLNKNFLSRLGRNLGSSILDTSADSVTAEIVDDQEIAGTLESGLNLGVDTGSNITLNLTEERSGNQGGRAHSPERTDNANFVEIEQILHTILENSSSASSSKTSSYIGLSRMNSYSSPSLHNARGNSDDSVSEEQADETMEEAEAEVVESLDDRLPAFLRGSAEAFGGMWQLAQQLVIESYNAGVGAYSAYAYHQLSSAHKEAAAYIAEISG